MFNALARPITAAREMQLDSERLTGHFVGNLGVLVYKVLTRESPGRTVICTEVNTSLMFSPLFLFTEKCYLFKMDSNIAIFENIVFPFL